MGLTQMELAERVGLRQQVTISLLESGRGESSPAVWRRLESVLGVPMAELRTVGDAR
jgi:transcriptional regulator with XRE-family HTH domain